MYAGQAKATSAHAVNLDLVRRNGIVAASDEVCAHVRDDIREESDQDCVCRGYEAVIYFKTEIDRVVTGAPYLFLESIAVSFSVRLRSASQNTVLSRTIP